MNDPQFNYNNIEKMVKIVIFYDFHNFFKNLKKFKNHTKLEFLRQCLSLDKKIIIFYLSNI